MPPRILPAKKRLQKLIGFLPLKLNSSPKRIMILINEGDAANTIKKVMTTSKGVIGSYKASEKLSGSNCFEKIHQPSK